MPSPRDITALLGDWSRGNRAALNQLLPLVYAELRRIAGRHLRRERAGHTLQPTALVHEVYLRLIEEAACVLGVSPSTAKREWRTPKAWLDRELGLDSHP
jgi:DNA-directed RNA polymerase specialized sigma24 family protein